MDQQLKAVEARRRGMRKTYRWDAIDHGLRTQRGACFSLLFPRKQGRPRASISRSQAICLCFQRAIQARRARAVKIEQGKHSRLSGKGSHNREGTGRSRAVSGGPRGCRAPLSAGAMRISHERRGHGRRRSMRWQGRSSSSTGLSAKPRAAVNAKAPRFRLPDHDLCIMMHNPISLSREGLSYGAIPAANSDPAS